jgi:hypothetical protein
MLRRLKEAIRPSKGKSLAGAFHRLGWAGFWLQVVFGSLPIIGMAYALTLARSDPNPRGGLGLVEYLTIVDLLFLLFTTLWSYRYVRLGRRIRDPQQRPPESDLIGAVWTGVVASTAGMLFSMIILLIEAGNLLFYFLKSPQAGIPVIQTAGAQSPHWVSSVDMLSLMALILILFAEMIVLVFSLWLLFQTTLGSPELPEPAAQQPASQPVA